MRRKALGGDPECLSPAYPLPFQPFCHVRIENGSDGAYKELRFVFRQISATEVRLAYIELERMDGNV